MVLLVDWIWDSLQFAILERTLLEGLHVLCRRNSRKLWLSGCGAGREIVVDVCAWLLCVVEG
jgi:hypothetical protein